ncbi:hypothetical protein LOK49_LG07G02748 [Camellia lanceoleosa]|uniref:Uncharacterized protein n=1 Tax=Camellia lanceoleosa TaxID=1840588 RepID=A0ACC0GZN7_9ERIC|nr:hypothetical protein LOK49_LG07G02748 [Camellia lanceoleosa]
MPGASVGVVGPNGLNTKSANAIHQANGISNGARSNGKPYIKNNAADMSSKACRPHKIRKVDIGSVSRNGNEELASKTTSEVRAVNGNGNTKHNSKIITPNEIPTSRCSAAPAFDARKLLMDKARAEICKKLEELRVASAAAAEKNAKTCDEVGKAGETSNKTDLALSVHQPELKKTVSVPITVPDSDFHDFDKDRSEECFKPKQIWAIYDEEDGMPRLYCLIREIISVKPFKIHISYLNSKSDDEFGSANWVDSGFSKSCGNFRAGNYEVVDQVNIFSHLLSRVKAGRGGTTPGKVRHQYDMVEVLDDYTEELGVCVTPLIKLDGFKTVYQRNKNKNAIQLIPRKEMLRFSHQVPSWILQVEGVKLPDGCWDLDPAATPDELLVAASQGKTEDKP